MRILNLSEEVQARVMAGSLGQDAAVNQLKQRFGEQLKVVSIAQVGKTTVDIEVEVEGKRIRLEVKTVNNPKQVRTAIYDTVMSLKTLGKSDPIIDKFVQSATGSPSFNMWIRKARLKDTSIGYPGQAGVDNITGKLPTGRTSRSPQYLNAVLIGCNQHSLVKVECCIPQNECCG